MSGSPAVLEPGRDASLPTGRRALALTAIAAQFLLALAVLRVFKLLDPGLLRLAMIALPAFCLHWFLPARWKLPFFAALSLASPIAVLGLHPAGLKAAACVLAFGLALVGVCMVPAGFWTRAALLAACGLLLAALHAGWIGAGWIGDAAAQRAWPMLASFFMFRSIVYLYDTSHNRQRPGVANTLAYFFLFPNAGNLFFPVVDFKTFTRTRLNEDALAILQRGMGWITRGIVQLLVHRFVVQVVSIPATDVANGAEVVQYVVATLLSYLRVSGQFHLVIGLVLLFGFNLPETNHRYFLASSFTDYWRRVNIYWKDFMMKVFYYPAFFRLRKLGQARALVLATLFTFLMTWVLHAYQTWWLTRGSSFSWPDTLFWTALALIVVVTAYRELKGSGAKIPAGTLLRASDALRLCMRTAATFTTAAVLWSLWYSGSLTTWFALWSHADGATAAWGAAVIGVIVVATLWYEVLPRWRTRPAGVPPAVGLARPLRQGLACAVALAAILPFGYLPILPRLPARVRPFAEALSTNSGGDAVRGYYDELFAAGPEDHEGVMWRMDTGWNGIEMAPNASRVQQGIRIQSNEWGMRDHSFELARPPATVRMALFGSSNVFGVGVQQEQTFKQLLEDRLNREPLAPGARVEILNFAMPGFSPINQIPHLELNVGRFQPQVVIVVAHSLDVPWVARELADMAKRKVAFPEPYLGDVLAQAGVDERTNSVIAASRLMTRAPEILAWTYRKLVAQSRAVGALPVCVFMPAPFEAPPLRRIVSRQDERDAALKALIEESGFRLVDLSGVFDGHDKRELCLPNWDDHGTPRAHALLAELLHQRLLADTTIDLPGLARNALESASAGESAPKPGTGR